MKIVLTLAQWQLLDQADNPNGTDTRHNINTMSALVTKSLVYFKGPKGKERMYATAFGSTHMAMRRQFQKTPAFRQNRENINRRYR
jgi:hypothetical protein